MESLRFATGIGEKKMYVDSRDLSYEFEVFAQN